MQILLPIRKTDLESMIVGSWSEQPTAFGECVYAHLFDFFSRPMGTDEDDELNYNYTFDIWTLKIVPFWAPLKMRITRTRIWRLKRYGRNIDDDLKKWEPSW